jgi:hypothetical protein
VIYAIAGFAPDSRNDVNDEPKATRVLSMNNADAFLTHAPYAWFQIHPPDWNWQKGLPVGSYGRDEAHLKMMAELKCPLYMLEPHDEFPASLAYPLQEITGHFGHSYFTSTMAYIMGWLLWKFDLGAKVDEIKIFGINLTTLNEYYHQKACMEYWIGLAEGRGITVTVPTGSGLRKGNLYARDTVTPDIMELFAGRVDKWRDAYQAVHDECIAVISAYQETKAWFKLFDEAGEGGGDAAKLAKGRMDKLYQTGQTKIQQVNSASAALRESENGYHNLGGVSIPSNDLPPLTLPDAPAQVEEILEEAVG